MFRRTFLTSTIKAGVIALSLSTGLNKLSAILPARNKTRFTVDWIPKRTAWLLNGMEVIGGENWSAPDYFDDKIQLSKAMRASQSALHARYNLIHGVS